MFGGVRTASAALLLAVVVGASGVATATAGEQAREGAPLRIVVLGDSEATGHGDATGIGWTGRYARLLRARRGLRVVLTNLARDDTKSAELLAELRTDSTMRAAVRRADVVVFAIGGADLNTGDDRWAAGGCTGIRCYAGDLRAVGRNLDAMLDVVETLRGSSRTALRAVTPPNALTGAEDVIPAFLRPVATEVGVFQARTLRDRVCNAVSRHGGRCIDTLGAINGRSGTGDGYASGLMNHADCCYPSGAGQQRMAVLLLATGLKPVR
jgi:hypothetical protein